MKTKKIYMAALIISCFIISNCSENNVTPVIAEEANPVSTDPIELPSTEIPATQEVVDPVEGWAVLAAKDDYSDVGMADLLVDYIDTTRMREALLSLGWESEKIHVLNEFDSESLKNELDWLQDAADENDLVLFYVTGHGRYLSEIISWSDFFPIEWGQIASTRRLLIVDSCQAGKFTDVVNRDPNPHFSIAAVSEDELGWKGLEEEGLPIIGGVFTYYLSEALTSIEADSDDDGLISIWEAVNYAEENQRKYLHEVAFSIPEFVEDFHALGYEPEKDPTYPNVIVDDTIYEELFLNLETYSQ